MSVALGRYTGALVWAERCWCSLRTLGGPGATARGAHRCRGGGPYRARASLQRAAWLGVTLALSGAVALAL